MPAGRAPPPQAPIWHTRAEQAVDGVVGAAASSVVQTGPGWGPTADSCLPPPPPPQQCGQQLVLPGGTCGSGGSPAEWDDGDIELQLQSFLSHPVWAPAPLGSVLSSWCLGPACLDRGSGDLVSASLPHLEVTSELPWQEGLITPTVSWPA